MSAQPFFQELESAAEFLESAELEVVRPGGQITVNWSAPMAWRTAAAQPGGGLYEVRKGGSPIYVGKARQFQTRLGAHLRELVIMKVDLSPYRVRVGAVQNPTEARLLAAEHATIRGFGNAGVKLTNSMSTQPFGVAAGSPLIVRHGGSASPYLPTRKRVRGGGKWSEFEGELEAAAAESELMEFAAIRSWASGAAQAVSSQFTGAWARAVAALRRMQDEFIRHGCWCGPGDRCATVRDEIDRACQAHDLGYNAVRVNTPGGTDMWTPRGFILTERADGDLVRNLEATKIDGRSYSPTAQSFRERAITLFSARARLAGWARRVSPTP